MGLKIQKLAKGPGKITEQLNEFNINRSLIELGIEGIATAHMAKVLNFNKSELWIIMSLEFSDLKKEH